MQGQSRVPEDFGARVRASRAYADDMSQADLADALGMSPGYVKNVEKGKGLKDLEARSLLERLPEITGLPRSFFTGHDDDDAGKLDQILAAVEEIQTETRARYAALEQTERRIRHLTAEEADEMIRLLQEARSRLGREIGRRSLQAAASTGRPGG